MANTDRSWRRFTLWLCGCAALLAAAAYAFILIANPFGIQLLAPAEPRPILDANQRFMYPQIIRARQHDSLVIGTSTSRLLEPEHLNETLGGRFANLALSDGRAWEQYRIADLFIRTSGPPKRLFVGLDRVWCDEDADTARITYRGFPEWLFDDDPWNDLIHIFNTKTFEIAGRRLLDIVGQGRVRFDRDGFGDFTPGDAAYDIARAREHIWQGRPHRITPATPPVTISQSERDMWRFPALVWLEELLDRTKGKSEVYLVFMPVHIAAQPIPGSALASREQTCKQRVQALSAHYAAQYADYRVPSDITSHDHNWWDPLHWRISVGRDLIRELADN